MSCCFGFYGTTSTVTYCTPRAKCFNTNVKSIQEKMSHSIIIWYARAQEIVLFTKHFNIVRELWLDCRYYMILLMHVNKPFDKTFEICNSLKTGRWIKGEFAKKCSQYGLK